MISIAGTFADTSLSNYGRFGAGSPSGGHSGGGHDTGTETDRQTKEVVCSALAKWE